MGKIWENLKKFDTIKVCCVDALCRADANLMSAVAIQYFNLYFCEEDGIGREVL